MLTGQASELPDDGRLTSYDLGLLCIAARHYAECVVQTNVQPDELRVWRLQQFDRAMRHANTAALLLRRAAAYGEQIGAEP